METPGQSRRVVDEARRAARLMNDNLAAVHHFELSKVKSNAAEASAKLQDELGAEKAKMMVSAADHTTPCSRLLIQEEKRQSELVFKTMEAECVRQQ